MKIKFLDLLEEDAAIQISTILYIVTYGLTYKYNVAKYFFIFISIIFCYNLVKKYFKEEKYIKFPFFIILLDLLYIFFAKFSLFYIIAYILTISSICYSEYKNYKRDGIYVAIELSIVYTIIRFLIFIRMFF